MQNRWGGGVLCVGAGQKRTGALPLPHHHPAPPRLPTLQERDTGAHALCSTRQHRCIVHPHRPFLRLASFPHVCRALRLRLRGLIYLKLLSSPPLPTGASPQRNRWARILPGSRGCFDPPFRKREVYVRSGSAHRSLKRMNSLKKLQGRRPSCLEVPSKDMAIEIGI